MTAISPLLVIEGPRRRAEVATFAPSGPVPAAGRPSGPPRLRAIEGGATPAVRRRRRVHQRRRLLVVALFVVAIAGGVRLVAAGVDLFRSPVPAAPTVEPTADAGTDAGATVLDPPGDPSRAAAGVGDDPGVVGSSTYVVRPGDTLWSIARRVRPGDDPRQTVDVLAARAPAGPLQPGQRLDLTDLDG